MLMSRLPNELIIEIYNNSSYENICKALEVYPFLIFMVKKKNRVSLWYSCIYKGNLEVIKLLHENRT